MSDGAYCHECGSKDVDPDCCYECGGDDIRSVFDEDDE